MHNYQALILVTIDVYIPEKNLVNNRCDFTDILKGLEMSEIRRHRSLGRLAQGSNKSCEKHQGINGGHGESHDGRSAHTVLGGRRGEDCRGERDTEMNIN